MLSISPLLLQVTGKRSEGKEAGDFQGGVYEAAVNQEKQDDRRSQQELEVGGDPPEEGDSSSEPEEISLVVLNVSPAAERIKVPDTLMKMLLSLFYSYQMHILSNC